MSGGVDSSVAAHLLVREGYRVIGVFMRHAASPGTPAQDGECTLPVIEPRGARQGCCTAADALDARRVADELGIAFYALDFQPGFERIMDYFAHQYMAGRTPNPCIVCNHWLKFGQLFDYADSVGADYVATGHYARLQRSDGGGQWQLMRGRDAGKDQSYVLFGIPRERLERMMLPVGDFHKQQIRQQAAAWKVRVADKPDSQEICFVDRGRHAQFVAARRGGQDASGELVTTDGRVVGRHPGVEHFTIGQRKGLGVALGEPHYVVRIEADSRRVILGRQSDLACRGLVASQCNWLVEPPGETFRCEVQIRYQSRPAPAVVSVRPSGMRVEFQQPVLGVAPGQAAVCYDGPRVLGGGWIDQAIPDAA
jgi:tRNA-specific 2-thiouridylase